MFKSLLIVAGLLAQALAQDPNSVSDLSPDALAKLQSDLLAWKSSPAGQEAVQMGLAPQPRAGISTLRGTDLPADQLQKFLDNQKTVEKLQKKFPLTQFSLQTPFALLTPQEFSSFVKKSNVTAHRELMQTRMLGSPSQQQQGPGQTTAPPTPKPIPTEVDWQQAGCVSHIKNQYSCGVCWIFAAVSTLESGYCINSPTKTLPVLSEQDILACGPNKGNCYGGWSFVAYDWLIRLNGGSACTEASVPYAPYAAEPSRMCTRYDDSNAPCDKVDLGLVSYVANQYPDHRDLEAVVSMRPVSAQLRAGLPYMQFYYGGVLMGDEENCPSGEADHEVSIVGYGERNGTKYWKIKNQWGPSWGEGGYAYLERGFQGSTFGTCGIESWSHYPIFRDQAPWTDNLRCSGIRYGVEIIGQPLKNVSVKETYSGGCCDACRREPGCKAAVYSSNVCMLKSTIDGERVGPDVPFMSVTVMPKSEANAAMCMPIEENVDYPGNDLSRTLTATAGECCDRCLQDPSCGAYTWTKWMGGSCFLKYSKFDVKKNNPQADGTPYFRSGEIYRCGPLRKDVDYPGQDFKNLPAKTAAECCNICRRNSPCQAFSWSNYQGGTCWLKTKASSPVANVGVFSATIY